MKSAVWPALALIAGLCAAGPAAAYEFKCETWKSNETRCLIRKHMNNEPAINGHMLLTPKQHISFNAASYFSTCGSSGKLQFSQDYTLGEGKPITLFYSLGGKASGLGCFEIFLSQCKSDGKAVDCFTSFAYEAPWRELPSE